MIQIISNPPLVRPKNEPQLPQARPKINNPPENQTNKIKRLNSKEVTDTIGKMYADITEVLIDKQVLDESNQVLDYNESREHFFKLHLSSLKSKLAESQRNI